MKGGDSVGQEDELRLRVCSAGKDSETEGLDRKDENFKEAKVGRLARE
jgi:hypothetical protein